MTIFSELPHDHLQYSCVTLLIKFKKINNIKTRLLKFLMSHFGIWNTYKNYSRNFIGLEFCKILKIPFYHEPHVLSTDLKVYHQRHLQKCSSHLGRMMCFRSIYLSPFQMVIMCWHSWPHFKTFSALSNPFY